MRKREFCGESRRGGWRSWIVGLLVCVVWPWILLSQWQGIVEWTTRQGIRLFSSARSSASVQICYDRQSVLESVAEELKKELEKQYVGGKDARESRVYGYIEKWWNDPVLADLVRRRVPSILSCPGEDGKGKNAGEYVLLQDGTILCTLHGRWRDRGRRSAREAVLSLVRKMGVEGESAGKLLKRCSNRRWWILHTLDVEAYFLPFAVGLSLLMLYLVVRCGISYGCIEGVITAVVVIQTWLVLYFGQWVNLHISGYGVYLVQSKYLGLSEIGSFDLLLLSLLVLPALVVMLFDAEVVREIFILYGTPLLVPLGMLTGYVEPMKIRPSWRPPSY